MTQTDLASAESRIARRLVRLFRIERVGGFDRWGAATAGCLIARRGELVEELLDLDQLRRSLAVPRPPDLQCALAALSQEVDLAAVRARTRAEQIAADLSCRLGDSPPSGMRDSGNGHLLGKI